MERASAQDFWSRLDQAGTEIDGEKRAVEKLNGVVQLAPATGGAASDQRRASVRNLAWDGGRRRRTIVVTAAAAAAKVEASGGIKGAAVAAAGLRNLIGALASDFVTRCDALCLGDLGRQAWVFRRPFF